MAQITPEQTTKAIHPVLGIMGGLGPAASCYLYQMITDHTPAQKDQDHIDIVISSRASTPDRTAFIVGKSKDDPFDVMEQDGISLEEYARQLEQPPSKLVYVTRKLGHLGIMLILVSWIVPVLHA